MSRTLAIAAAAWILALLIVERATETDVQLLWSGPLIVFLSIGTEIVIDGWRWRRGRPPMFLATTSARPRRRGHGTPRLLSALGAATTAWFFGIPVGAALLAVLLAVGVSRPASLVVAVCAIAGIIWATYRLMRDPEP